MCISSYAVNKNSVILTDSPYTVAQSKLLAAKICQGRFDWHVSIQVKRFNILSFD